LRKAKEISMHKPLIILKPGQSKEAQEAISSHTGSIAGNYKTLETGLKQNGVIQATSVEEFFHLMMLFNNFPVHFGDQIAIITNAGGPAVIATEELVKNGLKLAKFSSKTEKNLLQNLPSTINIRDPLDVVGDALTVRYEHALKNLIDDDNVDTILILLTPQFMTEIDKTARMIIRYAKQKKKLILTSFLGGVNVRKGIYLLWKSKVAHFRYPNQAVHALGKIVEHQNWCEMHTRSSKVPFYSPISSHHKMYTKEIVKGKKSEYLSDQEAFTIAKLYDIPTAEFVVSATNKQAKVAFELLKFPLAMKISSPMMIHKTDTSGIITGVKDKKNALVTFEKLMKTAKKNIIANKINGILMQEMVGSDIELIIGIKKDKNFGHLLMFGTGGIYTEVYKDVAFRLIPTGRISINNMIEETKVYKILTGARGKSYDLNTLKHILMQIQQLVQDFPMISELDINPLIVNEKEIKAVDVKIKIG